MKRLMVALIALTTPAMTQDKTCVTASEFKDAIPKADALARKLDELSKVSIPRQSRIGAKISAPFSDSYAYEAVHGDVAAALVCSIEGERSSAEG